MAPFTMSVARLIITPHRFLTRGGTDWQYNPPSVDNPAVLAEIPPAIQARLRRQSMVLPLWAGLAVFVLQCVMEVYGDGDWQAVINSWELAFCAILGVVIALYLYAFRAIRRFPLHREVRYRYRHGKWRWER